MIYRLGCKWFSPFVGLTAAGFLAVCPDMVLWGSLVRMYSLAIPLILLLVYSSYKMVSSPYNTFRWQFITFMVLAASFMNLFLTALFIPPLVVGLGILIWHQKMVRGHSWVLNMKTLLLWGGAIIAILAGSSLFQSSNRPNSATLASDGVATTNLSFITIFEQIGKYLNLTRNWSSIFEILSRTMWEYPFYRGLFSIAFLGIIIWVAILFAVRMKPILQKRFKINNFHKTLFLLVVSFGPILELTFFVDSYRQNPKYLIIFWPFLFLFVASILENFILWSQRRDSRLVVPKFKSNLIMFAFVSLFLFLGKPQFEHFLFFNPAAYEEAFKFVKEKRQSGDVVLTPYTAAAGLYLGDVDYYANDIGAGDLLFEREDNRLVDRFLGVPWIGTGEQLQDVLAQHNQTWFVVSDIVYDHYFRGDWHFVEQQNLELVWKEDSAMVFHSKAQGIRLPDKPKTMLSANLNNTVQLQGVTSSIEASVYRVYLFWNVISPLHQNFTQFVHIRNEQGDTVAQADFEPLNGQYSTTLWKPGETVVDVHDLILPADLPPGEYRVLGGLYRWDTLERMPVIDDTSGENAVLLEVINIP